MAATRFGEASFRENELTQSTENQSVKWLAPRLGPIGTTASIKIVIRAGHRHEDDLLKPPGPNNLPGSRRSFSSRRKLAAAITVGALGLCACAYFILTFSNNKKDLDAADPSAAAQPIFASPVRTTLDESGSSAKAAGSESSSFASQARPAELAEASEKAEPVGASHKEQPGVSQKIVSAAVPTTIEPRKSNVGPTEDFLFLQRPGVNIRSTPSKGGGVVGTAPKGTRFKVTRREPDWVQVQDGRLSGWINAQFLAPTKPR
jgi:cytoskeletal protein RodZ